MKPISQKKPTHTKRDPQVPLNVCFLESQRTCQSDASTLQGSFRSSARSCPCCRSCRWFVRDTTVVHVGNTVRITSLCTTLYFLGNQKKNGAIFVAFFSRVQVLVYMPHVLHCMCWGSKSKKTKMKVAVVTGSFRMQPRYSRRKL